MNLTSFAKPAARIAALLGLGLSLVAPPLLLRRELVLSLALVALGVAYIKLA